MTPDADANLKPYAERIADLADTHFRNGHDPFLPLLQALGCRYFKTDDVRHPYRYTIETPVQPSHEDEPMVIEYLLRTLRKHVRDGLIYNNDGFALINGFYAHERWRSCLSNLDDAHCLAALLASLSVNEVPLDCQTAGGSETAAVCLLLNAWLQPKTPFVEPPSAPDLTRLLFGEAWHSFNVEIADVPEWRVPSVIFKTSPPFMPGLIESRLECRPLALPSL